MHPPNGTFQITLHSDGKSLQLSKPNRGFFVLASDGSAQADLALLERLRAFLSEDQDYTINQRAIAITKVNALLAAERRAKAEAKWQSIADGKTLKRKVKKDEPKKGKPKKELFSLADLDL